MACGGCSDRRRMLVTAATALADGDMEEVKRQMAAVDQSIRRDAGALKKAAAARLGLGRR